MNYSRNFCVTGLLLLLTLSCSTHAIGQMPIQVEILDPDGQVIRTLQRDSA